jgi:hypothetical protein
MRLSIDDKLSEAKLRFYTLVNGYLAIGLGIALCYVIYTLAKAVF